MAASLELHFVVERVVVIVYVDKDLACFGGHDLAIDLVLQIQTNEPSRSGPWTFVGGVFIAEAFVNSDGRPTRPDDFASFRVRKRAIHQQAEDVTDCMTIPVEIDGVLTAKPHMLEGVEVVAVLEDSRERVAECAPD